MKTVLVIFVLFATHKASASFFDDFHNAMQSLKNSFNKILSNVISEVKHTLDCTVLTVEHVLALNEAGEAEYRRNCQQKATPAHHHIEHNKHGSHHSTQKIPRPHKYKHTSVVVEKEASKEEVKKEVRKSIDTICDSLHHEETKLDLESLKEILTQKHDRLSDVNAILREELDKISGEMKRKYVKHLASKSAKPSVESVYDEIVTLQKVEENDKNQTEIAEIDHVFDEIRQMLDMAKNGELIPEIHELHRTRKSSDTDETFNDTEVGQDYVDDTITHSVTESPAPVEFTFELTVHDSPISTTSKPENLAEMKNYTATGAYENVALLNTTYVTSSISIPIIAATTLSTEAIKTNNINDNLETTTLFNNDTETITTDSTKNYVYDNIRTVTTKHETLNTTELPSVSYKVSTIYRNCTESSTTVIIDSKPVEIGCDNKTIIDIFEMTLDPSYTERLQKPSNNNYISNLKLVKENNATIKTNTEKATIATTVSNIDDSHNATTATVIEEASFATKVSNINESQNGTTATNIEKTTIATTVSDIVDSHKSTNAINTGEANISITVASVERATIATTISDIVDSHNATTESNIQEATTIPNIDVSDNSTTTTNNEEESSGTKISRNESNNATDKTNIEKATIAIVASDIVESQNATNETKFEEVNISTAVFSTEDATIAATESVMDETNKEEASFTTTASNIDVSQNVTTEKNIEEGTISTTVESIEEATIAITVSDIDDSHYASTGTMIEEDYFASTVSNINESPNGTTETNIEKNIIATTVSDTDERHNSTNGTNTEENNISTKVFSTEAATIASTESEIDDSHNATTETNKEEAYFATTASNIDKSQNSISEKNIEDATVSAKEAGNEGTTFATTVSDIEDYHNATTGSIIADSSYATTIPNIDDSHNIKNGTNTEEANISTTVARFEITTIAITISHIADYHNATTETNIEEATAIPNIDESDDSITKTINEEDVLATVSKSESYNDITKINSDKATIATTVPDVYDSHNTTTATIIDDASIATTLSNMNESQNATTEREIEKTTIATTLSDIDERHNSTNGTNTKEAKILTVASIERGTVTVTTISDIDGSHNKTTGIITEEATTIPNIDEADNATTTTNNEDDALASKTNTEKTTIVTTVPDIDDSHNSSTEKIIDEATLATTVSLIDNFHNFTTETNKVKATISTTVLTIEEATNATTESVIDDFHNATTAAIIEVADFYTTETNMNEFFFATTVSNINKYHINSTGTNIETTTVSNKEKDTIVTTISNIDEFHNATTEQNFEEATIATTVSDIDGSHSTTIKTKYIEQATIETTESNIYDSNNATSKTIIEEATTTDMSALNMDKSQDAPTETKIAEATISTTVSEIDDPLYANTATNIEEVYTHTGSNTLEVNIVEINSDVIEATSRPRFFDDTTEPHYIKLPHKKGDNDFATQAELSNITAEVNKTKVAAEPDVNQFTIVKDTAKNTIGTTESIASEIHLPITDSGVSEVIFTNNNNHDEVSNKTNVGYITTESHLKEIFTESHILSEETNAAHLLNKKPSLPNRKKNDEDDHHVRKQFMETSTIGNKINTNVTQHGNKFQTDQATKVHNNWNHTQAETATAKPPHKVEIVKHKIPTYSHITDNDSNFTKHVAVTSPTTKLPILIEVSKNNEKSTLKPPESSQILRPHRRKLKTFNNNGTRRTRPVKRRKHRHTTTDLPHSDIQANNMNRTNHSQNYDFSVSKPTTRLTDREPSNTRPELIKTPFTSPKASPLIEETLVHSDNVPKLKLPPRNNGQFIDIPIRQQTTPTRLHSPQFKQTIVTTEHPKLETVTISPDLASLFQENYRKPIQPQLDEDTKKLLKRYKYSQVIINSLFNNPINHPHTMPLSDLFK